MCVLFFGADREGVDLAASRKFTRGRMENCGKHLAVGTAAQQQAPNLFIGEDCTYVWLGSPFISGELITKENIARLGDQLISSPEKLNGSFLIAISTTDQLTLITDRFGSIPIFYGFFRNKGIALSTGYRCLLEHLGSKNAGVISEPAIFEFLWMRRLFGEKTYHQNVKCLPSASLITVESFGVNITSSTQFWRHQSASINREGGEAEYLVERLANASDLYFSDDEKKFGLMLSGGLDSRALLSLGKTRYKSFTTARTKNNEFEIASELSQLFNVEHEFLKREQDYLVQNFEASVIASNAMTVFYECQFLGHAQSIASQVDIVHMGIYLDIFFCGHYLFKKRPQVCGRSAIFFILQQLDDHNLEETFIKNISYRLKTSNPESVVHAKAILELKNSLLESIRQKMDEGRQCGFSGHRLWEYMHLTDIGRHYSALMARSLACHVPVEIPCLENDLYDLALSMSIEDKVNWSAYQDALKKLSAAAMRIRNSNTNIKAHHSLFIQTILNVIRSAAGQLTHSGQIKRMPEFGDRSWPAVIDDLGNAFFDNKINDLGESSEIMSLSFIDPDRLRKVISEHRSGIQNHAVFLSLLLTLEHGLLRH